MGWNNSINYLRETLMDMMGVTAYVYRYSQLVLTTEGFIVSLDSKRNTTSSVVRIGQCDFITKAEYKPQRGDDIYLQETSETLKHYKVKERDGVVYVNCDNANSMIRVYVQEEVTR